MSLLTHPARRRSQSGRAILVVLALLILVVLGAAGWYVMQGRFGGQGSMTEAAARMAPANTQVFLAMDLDRAGISQLKQLEIIGTLLKSKEVQAFNEELKAKFGLTLEQDFLTWVTASGALFLAPAEGQQSLAQALQQAKDDGPPPFRALLVLKVRDEKQAQASLEKIQQKASEQGGTAYKTEDFQGATLHLPAKVGEGPAWAVHKGHLFVGFAAEDLKLGVATGTASLADAPGYKAALSKVKHHDGVVGYVDLEGGLKGVPLNEMGSPEAEQLVGAMRFLILGAGKEGNQTVSEWLLSVDPAKAGPLGSKVFSPSHNIALDSAELYPKDADFYFSLNLRMLYDIAYEIAGTFAQGKDARDMPKQFLGQQGIDFDKDVLGMLTGEISYSAKNMGRIQALQIEQISSGGTQDPTATMTAFQQVPLMFTLGIKDKASFDSLMGKVPQLGMMMSALPSSDVEGVTVRTNPASQGTPADQFGFAVTDKEVVVAVNSAKASIEAAVKARKSQENLKALPGYSRILGMAGTDGKAVGVLYQDLGRVYGDAAKELKTSGKASPEIVQVIEQLSKLYGASWSAVAMRADGLYNVSTLELGSGK